MNSYHIIFMEENKLEYIYICGYVLCGWKKEISEGMVTSEVKFNVASADKS